ncbi:MAG TPA: tyrosine-type recombinase/integrase [Candidatus Eisenbacteria bacterium]
MRARGLGRVYRRGNVWWVEYWFRGRQHRESARSSDRKDAMRLLRQRQAEIGTGRLIGPDVAGTTFEDLAEMLVADYEINERKSLPAMTDRVAKLREYFGERHPGDITSDNVTAYVRSRKTASAATVRYELAMLKRMFRLGLRSGKVRDIPEFPTIEVRNARKGFFEPDDFERVAGGLAEDLGDFVRFAYLTGWRRGEISGLTWRQVDFSAQVVRLEPGTTKNGEGRSFPFETFPELAGLLRKRRDRTAAVERALGRIVPWVFNRVGKPVKSFRKAWAKACAAAGVPGRLVHDLRRTAVRNLERAGVPRSTAMQLTGHRTEAVYRRYAIVSEGDLVVGVGRLAALHRSSRTVPAQSPSEPSGPRVDRSVQPVIRVGASDSGAA